MTNLMLYITCTFFLLSKPCRAADSRLCSYWTNLLGEIAGLELALKRMDPDKTDPEIFEEVRRGIRELQNRAITDTYDPEAK